jgi:hypothetical protein
MFIWRLGSSASCCKTRLPSSRKDDTCSRVTQRAVFRSKNDSITFHLRLASTRSRTRSESKANQVNKQIVKPLFHSHTVEQHSKNHEQECRLSCIHRFNRELQPRALIETFYRELFLCHRRSFPGCPRPSPSPTSTSTSPPPAWPSRTPPPLWALVFPVPPPL